MYEKKDAGKNLEKNKYFERNRLSGREIKNQRYRGKRQGCIQTRKEREP